MNASSPPLPNRQFIFIEDDRLQRAPTVANLVRPMPPLAEDASCHEVMERFLADPSLYALPVVDGGGRPVALVDRRGFVEFFTRPFSREIFGRNPILGFLGSGRYQAPAPIVVEEVCSIEDVSQIIIDSGMEHMVTGFLVTRDGTYRGVANGHDLLNVITQRKQAELYYLAHYDHLTGLPNRVLLGDRVAQACREAERKGHLVALLFVDLDRFKQINDSLGHRMGDAVLRALVGRLGAAARRADTVARIGGDEFVILMEDLNTPEAAEGVAQRLLDSLREPVEAYGHTLVVTASIGIAIYPRDDADLSRLLAKADSAMYEAKAMGRNGYRVYVDGSHGYNPARLSLENDLRLALAREQLFLAYQPQVDIADGRVRGVEALLRWQHPERGRVSPLEFIPLAEESGFIVELGEWVLRTACRQMAQWQAMGLPPLRMAINISAVQFHHGDFAAVLATALAHYEIDPGQVELELTESVLMHHLDEVLVSLARIKALGVLLAIDDFGTGFSSLNYLRRFPIDRLKIDQSFVRDIARTPANASITRAIIALADSLSLEVVAEGIEQAAERDFLASLGCREGQGHYYARPLAAADLPAWIAAAEAAPAPAPIDHRAGPLLQ